MPKSRSNDDLEMYRIDPHMSDQEMYNRKRIHDLVDRLAAYYSEVLKDQEHIISLEKTVAEKAKEIKNITNTLSRMDRKMVAVEQQLGVLNKIMWLVAGSIVAYITANIMNLI